MNTSSVLEVFIAQTRFSFPIIGKSKVLFTGKSKEKSKGRSIVLFLKVE